MEYPFSAQLLSRKQLFLPKSLETSNSLSLSASSLACALLFCIHFMEATFSFVFLWTSQLWVFLDNIIICNPSFILGLPLLFNRSSLISLIDFYWRNSSRHSLGRVTVCPSMPDCPSSDIINEWPPFTSNWSSLENKSYGHTESQIHSLCPSWGDLQK